MSDTSNLCDVMIPYLREEILALRFEGSLGLDINDAGEVVTRLGLVRCTTIGNLFVVPVTGLKQKQTMKIRLQWGAEYRTGLVCKWLKLV